MTPFTYGFVLTPGQWSQLFAQKQDALGYKPVNRAGDTVLVRSTRFGFQVMCDVNEVCDSTGCVKDTTCYCVAV